MVQCTKCSAPLDEDFGLVTCQNCGAQLLIEIDGQVVEANQSPPSDEAAGGSFSVVKELTQNMLSELDDNLADSQEHSSDEELEYAQVPSFDNADQGESYLQEEPIEPQQEDNAYWDESPVVHEALSEQQVQEGSYSNEEPKDAVPTEEPESEEEAVAPENNQIQENYWPDVEPTAEQEVMQEIQEFANSEEASLDSGPLLYDLRLQGIDTKELRVEVLESLKDSRLGLSEEELNINAGCMIISKLNPVVVSIVVQRLKHLPISIDWRQHAAYA